MNATTSPSIPRILSVNDSGIVVGANRFTAETISFGYGLTVETMMKKARCRWRYNNRAPSIIDGMFQSGEYLQHEASAAFDLIKFNREPVSDESVREAFKASGMRPANFAEIMGYMTHHHTGDKARSVSIHANGENDLAFQRECYQSKSPLKRFLNFITFRSPRFIPHHPSIEMYGDYNVLDLKTESHHWKNSVLFLGVYVWDHDLYLIPREISRSEYDTLIPFPYGQGESVLTRDTLYLMKDGSMSEVVPWSEMDYRQCGHILSAPQQGLKRYRPVFTS